MRSFEVHHFVPLLFFLGIFLLSEGIRYPYFADIPAQIHIHLAPPFNHVLSHGLPQVEESVISSSFLPLEASSITCIEFFGRY